MNENKEIGIRVREIVCLFLIKVVIIFLKSQFQLFLKCKNLFRCLKFFNYKFNLFNEQ